MHLAVVSCARGRHVRCVAITDAESRSRHSAREQGSLRGCLWVPRTTLGPLPSSRARGGRRLVLRRASSG
jgi:hypothetical protein